MSEEKAKTLSGLFESFARQITNFTGSTLAFILAFSLIVVWLITGPVFNYSDTWQLVINTGTTIITFLMVFLIQRTQNKDSLAIHLKLNELVAAAKGASNRMIDVENLSEDELTILHNYFHSLVEKTKSESNLKAAHSIEETAAKIEDKVDELKEETKRIKDKSK